MQRWITLTTDFGLQDWFVGTLKGVIASIAPQARVVDITHEIPPGDVTAGALALAASCHFFPPKTIHVGIVDPGVGGGRPALLAKAGPYYYIGPDNGLFTLVLRKAQAPQLWRLDNPRYFLPQVSRTFHGRDVFAAVAAHLSRGVAPGQMGTPLAACRQLAWPEAGQDAAMAWGQVMYFDRFGNALTNLPNAWVGPEMTVQVRKRCIPVGSHYAAVPRGHPVAVPGSTGFLEIAVNQGHAQRTLRLRRGMKIGLVKKSGGATKSQP